MPLPPSTPDLGALDLLLSVVREGSVGAAARAHGLAQPTVSARLSQLERRLGLRLLERSTTGSTATEAGLAVAEWASEVVEAAERLVAGAQALRTGSTGRLEVVASQTIAERLVPGWLRVLHASHPDVAMTLSVANSAEVARVVRAGRATLGFVEGSRAPAGLGSAVVGEDRLLAVAAPGSPWAAQPLDVDALREVPLVLRERGSGTREIAERAVGPSPRRLLELGSAAAVRAAAAAGDGVAILSSFAVARDLEDGSLVALDVAGLDLRRRLRAVWRPTAPPSGLAAELLAVARA